MQIDDVDLIFGAPLRHGIGFGLPNEMVPLPSQRACFWGGRGGSLTVIDLDARATFCYAMNHMSGGADDRATRLALAFYAGLAS